MTKLPDLSRLSHDEKDALILALWAQVQALTAQVQILTARVAELEAKLGVPPKTPDNSSVPPSKGHKSNRAKKAKRSGPRQGSLGRTGGGRALAANPDEVVTRSRSGARIAKRPSARPTRRCTAAMTRSTCRRSPPW